MQQLVVIDHEGRIIRTWSGEPPADPDAFQSFKADLEGGGILHELAEGERMPSESTERWDFDAESFEPYVPPPPAGEG